MTRAEEQRRTFHILDMLRGIAALAVVGRHLGGTLFHWLPGSHLAVDFFFLLSGLVVSHAYEHRLASGRMGVGAFFRLRLIRLYPLYLLGTILTLLGVAIAIAIGRGTPATPVQLAGSLAFALFFLPTPQALSFDAIHLYPLNYPTWSLFWELVVNLLYALVARWLTGWRLGAIVAVGAVIVAAASLANDGLDIGFQYGLFLGGGERVIFSFFAGVAIEHARRRGLLPHLNLPAVGAAAILLLIFALRPAHAGVYDAAMVLLVFPPLIALSLGDPPRWAHHLCAQLGLASYAIYALQSPFVRQFGYRGYPLTIELALLAGLTLIALGADKLFDAPVREILRRRLPGPR